MGYRQCHAGIAVARANAFGDDVRIVQPQLRRSRSVKGQGQPLALQLRHEPLMVGAGEGHRQCGHQVRWLVLPRHKGHLAGIHREGRMRAVIPVVVCRDDPPAAQNVLHRGIGGTVLDVISHHAGVVLQLIPHSVFSQFLGGIVSVIASGGRPHRIADNQRGAVHRTAQRNSGHPFTDFKGRVQLIGIRTDGQRNPCSLNRKCVGGRGEICFRVSATARQITEESDRVCPNRIGQRQLPPMTQVVVFPFSIVIRDCLPAELILCVRVARRA